MPANTDELIRQASRRGAVGRGRVVLAVADLWSRGPMPESEASELLRRLLVDLARSVEREVRLRLAERLAEIDWAPHELVVMLANDEIDVAREVILRSAALLDDDLIDIADVQSTAHRQAIASRPGICEEVSLAVARPREPIVLTALVANASAKLTRTIFETCLETARAHPPLRRPLAERDEMPCDIAERLYTIVGEELRREIVRRFPVDGEALSRIVSSLVDPSGTEENEADETAAAALVAKLKQAGKLSPSVAVKASMEGRIVLFDHAAAALSGLSVPAIRQAIVTGGSWAVALVCRAAGVERAAFPAVQRALSSTGRLPRRLTPEDGRAASNAFVTMSQDGARDALRRLAGEI